MQKILMVAVWLLLVVLSGCRGCTEQLDPTGDWKKFKKERILANEKHPTLDDDGRIPTSAVDGEEQPTAGSFDGKYNTFCSSCHGVNGDGKGPAGTALNPPPRDFITWNDPTATDDDYIAKVIREGGAAVGKSASMAPWGGVLSADELNQMVQKVRSFQKK